MDMEQRKINWRNRLYELATQAGVYINPKEFSLIVSMCQDAFNEGHKAGEEVGFDKGYQDRKDNPV